MNVEQIEARFEYWLHNNSTLHAAMVVGRQAGLSEVDTLKLAAVEMADLSSRLMATIMEASALAQPSPVIIKVSDPGEVATIVSSDHGRPSSPVTVLQSRQS